MTEADKPSRRERNERAWSKVKDFWNKGKKDKSGFKGTTLQYQTEP